MFLKSLTIQHLRNITRADLSFTSNVNLITGKNGAGKTSLLEAIYLLGRAKSFRPGHSNSPIQRGEAQLTIFSQMTDELSNTHKLGLTRVGKDTHVKIDGEITKKLSVLASTLPLVLITPLSHRLLDEGPEHRRRILNWGVFHVEHSYKTAIGNFSRTLTQRNNALRMNSSDLSVWNKAFVEYANQVNKKQSRYFDNWSRELKCLSEQFDFLHGLEVSFNRGWKSDQDLYDLLKQKEPFDKQRGYTSVGPQRADLIFKINGVESKQLLSRGQQKVLVIIAMLSQANLLERARGKKPLFLLDDLASELDNTASTQISDMLQQSGNQIFITSINSNIFKERDWSGEISMFHVEHGLFTECV